jgi:hypothetical protein
LIKDIAMAMIALISMILVMGVFFMTRWILFLNVILIEEPPKDAATPYYLKSKPTQLSKSDAEL